MQRFGKNKSELLDSWLEMDAADLTKECDRMGIQASGKHIENIQNLFEHLKKLEQEVEKDLAGGIAANKPPSYNQEKGGHQPSSNTVQLARVETLFKRPIFKSSEKS